MKRILFLLLGLLPQIAFAQGQFQRYCDALGTYCGDGSAFLIHVATRIGLLILQLVGGAAVVVVIYGGLRLIFSGGDDSAKDQTKQIIQFALIGLILAVLAGSLIQYVVNFVDSVANV